MKCFSCDIDSPIEDWKDETMCPVCGAMSVEDIEFGLEEEEDEKDCDQDDPTS